MARLRRTATAGRGRLVDAAWYSLEAAATAGRDRDDPAVLEALDRLTDDERAFVLDLHTGNVTERGCVIELIRRRFGPYDPWPLVDD